MNQNPQVLCFGEPLGLVAGQAAAPGSSSCQATMTFAGAEANVAIGLARQGVAAAYCAAVGPDWFGDAVRHSLRGEGVDISRVLIDENARTGMMIKQPQILSEPSVTYYRADSAFARNAAALAEKMEIPAGCALLVSGITPALRADVRDAFAALLRRAAGAGHEIYLDLNFRSKLWTWEDARAALKPLIGLCQVVLASDVEATSLTETATYPEAAAALLALGAKEVIIKRGHEGATYYGNGTVIETPVHAIPAVVDPIGAGDAFDAGFIAGRVKGYSLERSLQLGAVLGAAACTFVGDWEGLPLAAQTERILAGHSGSAR